MSTEKQRAEISTNRPVVFFDGVCHLCNSFVDWVVRHDRDKRILFAPLQGETAANHLTPEQRKELSSVLVKDGDRILEKSEAVLRVLAELPGWKSLATLRLIPRPLRDLVYDFVAKNRYRWFGKYETCRVPTPEERQSILP